MEIYDVREIEIFHTIEKIKEINKAVIFHQKFEEPDHFAIRQWQKVKIELQSQLREMLFALDALPLLIEATPTMASKPGAEKQMDVGMPQKRGMSAEHMAKIREARMAKRTKASASTGVAPKPKTEKNSAGGTTKKPG